MKAIQIVAVLCIAALIGTAIVSLTSAQNAAPPAAAKLPFANKVVMISFKSDTEAGATLQNTELKQIGGQTFIVGTDCYPDGWSEGQVVWVAVDDIAQFVEFKDVA
jgi:uncharacterized lipoprotein YajG